MKSKLGTGRAVVVGMLAFITVTGCGTAEGQTAIDHGSAPTATASSQALPERECHDVNVGAFRLSLFDYAPRTPAEQAAAVDVVVTARLIEIMPGYSEFTDKGDEVPYLVGRFAVLNEYQNRSPVAVTDGEIFLKIYQGPISVEDGVPSYSIEDFRGAVPAGVDVVLFANVLEDVPTEKIAGLPAGAQLIGAGPQGLLVDDCGTLVNAGDTIWPPEWAEFETIDQLEQALPQLVG